MKADYIIMYDSRSEELMGEYNGLNVKAIGEKIDKLIVKLGLSKRMIAEKLNLSVQAIYKWCYGCNLPDLENMYLLSRIFGVKVDDLLVPNISEPFMVCIESYDRPDPEARLRVLLSYCKPAKGILKLGVK